MKVVGCVSLLIVMSSAASMRRAKRVVGGHDEYNAGDFPFHVSLWYMGENNPYTVKTPGMHHTCGGSLIDPQWVLTSGACFDYDLIAHLNDTSLWKVVLGMYDQRGASEVATFRTIETVFHPPEYDFNDIYGDISLLKLTEKVPLSDRIGLVAYNSDGDCPEPGEMAEVIGWGQTSSEEYGLGSDYPHAGDITVTSVDYCHDVYAEKDVKEAMGGIVIDNNYICAGLMEGGVGPCYGDAGSPLLYECGGRQSVVGIVSTGYGCGTPKYPAIFTRVSTYSDWITQTIKEYS